MEKIVVSGGGRIAYLDALKCLGIIIMIEEHIRLFGSCTIVYDSVPGLMLYSFNMPIFFFVSGFLTFRENIQKRDIVGKVWQKFVLLMIPTIMVKAFFDILHQTNPLNIIVEGFGGYWFTITLFECYCVYYFICFFFTRWQTKMTNLLLVACCGVVVLSLYGNFGPVIIDANRFSKYFQFFIFGIIAKHYKSFYDQVVQNDYLKAFSVIAFFAILFTLKYPIWPNMLSHLLRDLLLRYLGLFIILSYFTCHREMFERDNYLNLVISHMGKYSLAIYLLHYFFISDVILFPFLGMNLGVLVTQFIAFLYAFIVIGVCLVFISLLSNSRIVSHYILGKK